jgi:hypothetical protein
LRPPAARRPLRDRGLEPQLRRPKEITIILSADGGADGAPVALSRYAVREEWRKVGVRGRVRSDDHTSLSAFILVLSSIGVGDSFYVDGVKVLTTP